MSWQNIIRHHYIDISPSSHSWFCLLLIRACITPDLFANFLLSPVYKLKLTTELNREIACRTWDCLVGSIYRVCKAEERGLLSTERDLKNAGTLFIFNEQINLRENHSWSVNTGFFPPAVLSFTGIFYRKVSWTGGLHTWTPIQILQWTIIKVLGKSLLSLGFIFEMKSRKPDFYLQSLQFWSPRQRLGNLDF